MRKSPEPETAVPLNIDTAEHIALLQQIHTATVQGERAPARPRQVVDRSWQRMLKNRMSTELSVPDVEEQLVEETLDYFKHNSEVDLAKISKFLSAQLEPVLAGTQLVGIFTTPDARVIQRFGSHNSLHRADHLGFVRGARWSESVVGTNAIGTAAITRQALQIHGPEHWCLSQHQWSCSAAPIIDPRNHEILGILDTSGPLEQAHPALLGLVQALAHQVELMLSESHLHQLEQVRSRGWAAVSGLKTPWVLTDKWGWVAAASQVNVGERLGPGTIDLLPGPAVLEGIGAVEISRAGTGFLLQPAASAARPTYSLDVAQSRLTVVVGQARTYYRLSPKHRDIVMFLARSLYPQTLEKIAWQVWGADAGPVVRTSTARAEISRLRKRFPELISSSPYRLLEAVEVIDN